jgi:hypothetical protein
VKLRVLHLCPACGSDVFAGFRWTAEEWREYRSILRRPVCPECIRLLIVGPDDLELRVPTVAETFAAHVELEDIETVQRMLLKRLKLVEHRRRVR